ncbi:hypothetical protein VPH184E373B_0124 [Vibrio phage 184E37-3b]|nr:hypothetical protein MYOV056v2_p0109 [Vibrio phage 184E37.3a]QZI89945.1 hypothetical protein MYOV057v1_p0030 [Vibrio phage 184E37.1]
MNYKELLAFQPVLTQQVMTVLEGLSTGELSKDQFHNRKSYAKKRGNLIKVLEYSIAWEIYTTILEKENL